jgi:hypothetical protein
MRDSQFRFVVMPTFSPYDLFCDNVDRRQLRLEFYDLLHRDACCV